MYEYLIYNQLKNYAKASRAFHVPGHKAKGDFKAKFPVAPMDVTELPYSDNLQCPTGVILKAQEEIAKILGAKRSYILTDGSTLGVFAAIYAACRRGDKIIVPRNAHQSVWNACRVFGIEPVIVQGETRESLLTPPSPELIEKLVSGDVTITAMIATSPDYYGNIAPLGEYSRVLKSYGRALIVDEAHGAHLAFGDKKGYAGLYADIWVDGAHKTLPALTQGSVLSVNNAKYIQAVEEGLQTFRTTSPSYPIMASVEYGVKFLANNAPILEKARAAVSEFRAKSAKFALYPSDDWTKLVVDCKPSGISADTVAAQLVKKGIYPELSDGRYVIFYLSPLTEAGELSALRAALNSVMQNRRIKKDYADRPQIAVQPRTYSFCFAQSKPAVYLPLEAAVGKMCAANAGITPPCIPVVVAGEMITAEAVAALKSAKNTFGLSEGKIKTVLMR